MFHFPRIFWFHLFFLLPFNTFLFYTNKWLFGTQQVVYVVDQSEIYFQEIHSKCKKNHSSKTQRERKFNSDIIQMDVENDKIKNEIIMKHSLVEWVLARKKTSMNENNKQKQFISIDGVSFRIYYINCGQWFRSTNYSLIKIESWKSLKYKSMRYYYYTVYAIDIAADRWASI